MCVQHGYRPHAEGGMAACPWHRSVPDPRRLLRVSRGKPLASCGTWECAITRFTPSWSFKVAGHSMPNHNVQQPLSQWAFLIESRKTNSFWCSRRPLQNPPVLSVLVLSSPGFSHWTLSISRLNSTGNTAAVQPEELSGDRVWGKVNGSSVSAKKKAPYPATSQVFLK